MIQFIKENHSLWLLIGALTGALLATTATLEGAFAPLPGDVVATIDGETSITAGEFQSYLAAFSSDRGTTLSAAEQRRLLNRLIDERLLVRQGERSGLVQRDPSVRKAVIDAVVANVSSHSQGQLPTEAELAEFYEDNSAYFAPPAQLALRRMSFRGKSAAERAQQAHQALGEGEPWHTVEQRLADTERLPVPHGFVPENRLPALLGTSQTTALMQMQSGDISEVFGTDQSRVILQLQGRQQAPPPSLADNRASVLREYQRRLSDARLAQYLEDLRAAADVRLNETHLEAARDITTK